MKKITLILILISVHTIITRAQNIDTASQLAASYFNEAKAASENQRIWSKALYGPTLFVDAASRTTWANMPDSLGILKSTGDIYKGSLPKNIMVANTAITWGGRLWSVILWPLPTNQGERLNLIIHESFHRIQNELGLPANSPTVNHLNTMYGRIYFLMELQALKVALSEPANQRKQDLNAALLFREKRRLLFPETFNNERLLEMNEGLAEYTGVMLGRQKDSIINHLYNVIDHASEHESLIRSAAYITGPVYGYLLYQAAPDWTLKVDSNSSFPALISEYYHVNLQGQDINKAVLGLLKKYNGPAIIKSETLKEATHQKLIQYYTDLFTKKPVLIIPLVKMSVYFNPNNLFDLGKYGTVYPTAKITDIWGNLEVTQEGMLMKDWKVVYLSFTVKSVINGEVTEGIGWKLTLNKGWKIINADNLHYKIIKD